MRNKNLIYRLTVGLLLVGLVSCGFHLRGQIQLPERVLPVYIFEDDGYHDLRRKLRKLFKQSDITVTRNQSLASSNIKITKILQENQVASVDSLGRTREYRLISTVDFTITIDKSSFDDSIQVVRDLAFDSANILSYKKESKVLFDEMLSEQARLILIKMQAMTKRIIVKQAG